MKNLLFISLFIVMFTHICENSVGKSNEQKFKIWLNDTLNKISNNYEISDDTLWLTIKDSAVYNIDKGKTYDTLSTQIKELLDEYSEPPFDTYQLEIIKYTHFIPSEISDITYEVWCEFPMIKVCNENISIYYDEIRARINKATVIDNGTNDTINIFFRFDKGRIVKDVR